MKLISQVINCLKSVSRSHDISIVASIHQPNSDILSMFDHLYVLSIGGKCIFSGPSAKLRRHLLQCGIECTQDQIPIEEILTAATNEVNSEEVNSLVNKTLRDRRKLFENCIKEANLAPEGIPLEIRKFNFTDFWILLSRTSRNLSRTQLKPLITQFVSYMMIILILTNMYNKDIGTPDGCFIVENNANTNCTKSAQTLHEESLLEQNILFMFFSFIMLTFLQLVSTALIFSSETKIFFNEHKNGSYYI